MYYTIQNVKIINFIYCLKSIHIKKLILLIYCIPVFILYTMFPIININKKDSEAILELCDSHKICCTKIKLECKYDVQDIITQCTPLPDVLVLLICKWTDDEIELTMEHFMNSCYSTDVTITCHNSYVNFRRINFTLVIEPRISMPYVHNMIFDNSILLFESKSTTIADCCTITYQLYDMALEANKKSEKIHDSYFFSRGHEKINIKIINCETWLLLCDIIDKFKNNLKKIMTKS